MGAYIKGIGIISPQPGFEGNSDRGAPVLPKDGRFACTEPDYAGYIDSKQIRRMSRIIRMGTAASLKALKEAGIACPGGVIVGTAYGCLEDTEKFLSGLIRNKEESANPTPFIHSTHNSIASQIALQVQCRGYNSTYVHREISFESALLDASLLLDEGDVSSVLVGGIDELTDTSFNLLNRLGNNKGVTAGEGSSFFVMVNNKEASCYAELLDVRTFSFVSEREAADGIKRLLAEYKIEKPDLVLMGDNGNERDGRVFSSVAGALNGGKEALSFKHLCGEYPTASGFAFGMAAAALKDNTVLSFLSGGKTTDKKIKNILIYNQRNSLHHSAILLSAC